MQYGYTTIDHFGRSKQCGPTPVPNNYLFLNNAQTFEQNTTKRPLLPYHL